MRAAKLGPMLRTFWKVHRFVLRMTGGRLGSRLGGMQVLMLETIGRMSGQPRSVGLFFLEGDGPYFVAGSYSGEDRDPAWVKNLRAQPKAIATVRGRAVPVFARELEGAEREETSERFVQADDSYGAYRDRASREIPVIELRSDGA
jgi:deazaflavin-dependent oxidoreductase (nitroreductase family)